MKKNQYQNTLNLPQTAFPMKANLAQREPSQIEGWLNNNLYQQLREQRKGCKRFTLHDGPPYANGDIHIGHAVNKIIKDMIIKSRSLSGFDAPYVPGWDCHGLPIEWKIETKFGKIGTKLDARAFRQKCREYADKQIERQKKDFIRLGVVGDWENPYLTKRFEYEAAEVRALAQLIDHGHVARGFKSVFWSYGCASALAEAEVEYEDKESNAIDVIFLVENTAELSKRLDIKIDKPVEVAIWTTTPWTLPANQAVCLNAELEYALVQCQGKLFILGKELVEDCVARYGWQQGEWEELSLFSGEKLEGVLLKHPFYERQVPIVLGKHVTMDSGTGCVHTAPAHGPDDFNVGVEYQLDATCPVDENGVFYKHVELVGGQFIHKAETFIIDLLREHGRLLASAKITHSYPHCWRTKTPLLFRATSQWFISMDKLRPLAVKALDSIKFVPDWGKGRLLGMIENRPDWCISRQRYWGVPIPLFTHKESGELHPNTKKLLEKIADRIGEEGVDVWFDSSPEDWLEDDANDYEQTKDILDVWYDSGTSHYAVGTVREDVTIPADLYLEGSDQHRGWFQSSLLTSLGMYGRPAYKCLLTHGFTVDENGRKMSKSLGNVIAPQKICDTYGADVLRLWVASSDYRNEMSVSDGIVKHTAEAYRRIRNTARFMLSNLYDFDPEKNIVETQNMVWLDRWALDRAFQVQETIQEAFSEYRFHLVYQEIHHFCSIDMGSFYLDIIKDRLYTVKADGVARRSAQTALYHIIEALSRWIAPILSFTADELWHYIPGDRSQSVLLAEWYQKLEKIPENVFYNRDYWNQVSNVRDEVSKHLEIARKNAEIGSSLDAEVDLYVDHTLMQLLSALEDELRFVLITSYARIYPIDQAPEQALESNLDGLKIHCYACKHEKCARSWHRREDVGSHPEYPDLDARSIININGEGEKRIYA